MTTQRLPVPGSDAGDWGSILNDYLEVSLASDGTLNDGIVGTNQIAANAVTNAQLDTQTQTTLASTASKYTKPASGIPATDLTSSVQTNLTAAGTAVQSVNNKTGTSITLAASDIDALPTTTKLSGLADTAAAAGAANAQVLQYSSSSQAWVPATVSSTTVSNATSSTPGIVQLAGDIDGGTATAPQVTATHLSSALPLNQGGTGSITQNFVDLSGVQTISGAKTFSTSISTPSLSGTTTSATTLNSTSHITTNLQVTGGSLATGNVLTSDANGNATWGQPTGSAASDATTNAPGLVQLAGDLTGSATAPTVTKLNGISLPVSGPVQGNVLTATGSSATEWSTPADGVALDSTASDIQPLGTTTAGSTGQAADAGHVHTMPSHSQVLAPTTSVSWNTQKLTSLAYGTNASDAAAFGQIPIAGTTAGTYAVGNDSRLTGALQSTDNLSDLGNTTTARTNLGLGSAATQNSSAFAVAGSYAVALAPLAAPVSSAGTDAINTFVPVDISGGSIVRSLPSAPADESRITYKVVAIAGTNTLTINSAGSDVFNISGGLTSLTLKLIRQSVSLQYNAAHAIWYVLDGVGLSELDTRYLHRIAYVDTFGGDNTGSSYSDAAFNAALASLPTVNGMASGEIRYSAGTYKHGATALNNIGPQVMVSGAGMYATFISYTGSGDCFRLYNPNIPSGTWTSIVGWAGGIQALTVDGTSAGAGAAGVHYGDNEGGYLNLAIQNFSGVGSIGLHLDNTLWWTEKTEAKAMLLNNTQNVVLSVQGNATTTGNSYGYNNFDFVIFANTGQDGVAILSGSRLYNSFLKVRGNFLQSTTSQNNAALRLSGTVPSGANPALVGNSSTISTTAFDIMVEANTPSGGGTNKPYSIYFGSASNTIFSSRGLMNFAGSDFKATNINATTSTTFAFSGFVGGDNNLNPGNGVINVYGTTYNQSVVTISAGVATLKLGYGDFFDLGTLSANLSVPLVSAAVIGPALKIIRATQGTGSYTLTWPKNASPTYAAPTVLWANGTTPTMTATAGAIDVYELRTYDGITWYGTATQALA